MINIQSIDELPVDAKLIVHLNDGTINVFFENDAEYIEQQKQEALEKKDEEIYREYSHAKRALKVDKKTFLGLQAAAIAGVGRKGRSAVENKQDHKNAVLDYQSNQDKRDDLLERLYSPSNTKEDIENITW